MIRTTPFHERLGPLNETGLWEHWSGCLTATKYQLSEKAEYFADPQQRRAVRLVAALQVPDPRPRRRALPGRRPDPGHPDLPAGRGPVHDLVRRPRLRHRGRGGPASRPRRVRADRRRAEPGLPRGARRSPRRGHRGRLGRLGGPRDPGSALPRAAGRPDPGRGGVALLRARGDRRSRASRSTSRGPGSPGDLGYEVWVRSEDALAVWDAVWAASRGQGIVPIGMTALYMARIEAGLLLLDVDFHSSRFAWTDADRSTPVELGLGWMLRDVATDDRAFIGRDAIRRELAERTSRWKLSGLVLDWREYDRIWDAAGLIPPKDHTPDPGRVLRLRRRAQPARLRDQPDVLADAPAPHRPGPGPARPERAGLAGEARAGGRPPLRVLRRRRDPDPPLQPRAKDRLTCRRRRRTPRRRPGPEAKTAAHGAQARAPARRARRTIRWRAGVRPGRPRVRRDRDRGRSQRADERRLPGEGRPQDAHPGTAPPGRRRGDHRGAPAGLLVHHVLLRPEPAPAGHRPGPRADEARLHAAPHADHVLPDGGRRLPAPRPGPRREPAGDRPAQPPRRRRLRRLQPRHHQGPPGPQAAHGPGPARHLQRRSGGAGRAGGPRPAVPRARPEGRPRRGPAADRVGGRLPRRLLRVGHPQGLPGLVEHHRDEGRAVLPGFRAGPPLPPPGRARRRVRGLVVPQGRQRRVHPGPGPGRPRVRGGDRPRVAGRPRHHEGRSGDRGGPGRRARGPGEGRRLVARSASDLPRAGRAARAAGRPGRDDRPVPLPGDLVEGQLRPRRGAALPGPRRPDRPVPRLHQHRARR